MTGVAMLDILWISMQKLPSILSGLFFPSNTYVKYLKLTKATPSFIQKYPLMTLASLSSIFFTSSLGEISSPGHGPLPSVCTLLSTWFGA